MTTGQLLFYAGAGLLALTILLAIIFAVKKPQYHPESVSVLNVPTTPLKNWESTEPFTVREPSGELRTEVMTEVEPAASATEVMEEEPAAGTTGWETEVMPPEQQTELMGEATEAMFPMTEVMREN